jgi:DNA-binding NarL/FixJ family response regulator
VHDHPLVADDQDLVRAGLKMILDAQPDIDVVSEAVRSALADFVAHCD